MASFSQSQVHRFEEIFKSYCDDGETISNRDSLVLAVQECLGDSAAFNLSDNIENFSIMIPPSTVLSWQNFFQVLMHINRPAVPEDHLPIDFQSSSERVYGRVTFDSPAASPNDRVSPLSSESRRGFSSSLRRVGEVVGNFFGVTEASQHGSYDTIGWEEFTERRVEESNSSTGIVGTLSRRVSQRRVNRIVLEEAAPPDYPQIASGRSFNLEELDDHENAEDNLFVSEAPPDYHNIVPAGSTSNWEAASAEPAHHFGQFQLSSYPETTYPPGPEITMDEAATSGLPSPQSDLIYKKKEAWDFYQKFIKAEKTLRRRMAHVDALEFFGNSTPATNASQIDRTGSLRRERISSVGSRPDHVPRRNKKYKRTKLQRQSTLIRNEVESLPSFWPVCTIIITLAQVVGMIVLLPLFGIAPIHVFPQENVVEVPVLNGTTPGNVSYYRSVNLWIGPTATNLIQFGAKFTPCMRTDFGIRRRNAELYNPDLLGCCLNQDNVGTVPNTECGFYFSVLENLTAVSSAELNRTGYQSGVFCSSNQSIFFLPNFHPCCISITGLCKVMSFEECESRRGFYHPDAESCQEVNCFRKICGFNEVGISEDGSGLQPAAQQFWRWFLSIFLHLGVLHLLIYMPIQLYLGIKIERTIGWLRFCIIYLLSGVGGNIISAVFVPYGVNCGVGGAVFGLLAVLFVELFQFWQIVDKAWLELFKLTSFVLFLLLLGMLPYIDNFAQVGGLLFGIPSAIVFVPYITFGKWDAARKRILLIVCIPLLIILYLAGFFTFYFIPDPSFCPWCHYINCVPFVPGFCPEEFSNPNPVIFGL